MRVESMRADEIDAVAEITVGAYEHDAATWPSGKLSDDYRQELAAVAERAAETAVLVAHAEDRIVGTVTYIDSSENPYAEFDDPEAASLRMLAVDTAAQRSGAGRMLVDACIAMARAQGKKRVVLHTAKWMASAQRFYERLGFERAPELDWTPLPHVPLLGYSFELEGPAIGDPPPAAE